MVVIFAAMLGYDRRTAVGTSTFIMTFTALILIVIRFTTKVPDYIFRKLLHVVAFTSILPLVQCTDYWLIAVLVEKGKHEVITSFIMLFSLMTILMAVFWGGFGDAYAYITVASIMAWTPSPFPSQPA